MHRQKTKSENDDITLVQVEYLMKNPLLLNKNGIEGITRLHLAAMHGHERLVQRLIDEDCRVDVRTSSGKTPLDMAIESGYFYVAETLLCANAELPVSKESTESAFRMILKNIFKVPQSVCKRFYEAIKSTKSLVEIVALMVEMQCPLPGIVAMQDAELTKSILKRREEIDCTESTSCIDVAMKLLDVANIEALMHYGEDSIFRVYRFFNCLQEKALCERDNFKALSVVVEKMPDWNIWDEITARIIGDVFEKAYEDVVTMFLQHNVHLRIKQLLNVDVVVHSFGNANPGVIDLIKKLVADGYSPGLGLGDKCALHFAMKACIFENIVLLWYKANVSCNLRDAMGRTPLFEVFNSDQDVVKKRECVIRLLFYVADVQILDKSGMNLLDFHHIDDDWIVIQTKLAHLAMLESLGHSVDEKIRLKINNTKIFANYYKMCSQQLEDMKYTRLGRGVTVYTLLTANFYRTFESSSVRKKALKLLNDDNWFSKFDLYYLARLSVIVMNFESINNDRSNASSVICEGMTHLHLAAMHGNKVLTKHFVDEGCCVNVQTSTGMTPLMIAIRFGRFEVAEILLRSDAKIPLCKQSIENSFYSILINIERVPQYVCRRYYEAIKPMKLLMEIVALIEEMNCSLQAVVAMQDAKLTKKILVGHQEINDTESSDSMDVAIELLDVPNIEVLLHYGKGRMDRVDRFFDCLKEIIFVGKENFQVLNVLVEKIPEWDIWDLDTANCIGEIFEEADEDVLKIFLQHKVHLRIKQLLNVDVIAHSFGNAEPGVAELILELVADGYSPGLGIDEKSGLHFAMKACIIENIAFHWKNVSCNLQDAMGRTPLFEVFNSAQNLSDKVKCVEQLLFLGADVQVFDDYGMNLLDFHRTNDDWTVIQPMLAHLAVLESLGESVDESIRLKINSIEIFAEFYATCHQQLEDMKNTSLCLGVTAYTILTMYIRKLEQSTRSEALKLLKDSNYLEKFNAYYQCRFTFNIGYIEAINRGKDNLSSIICECCEMLAPYPLIVDKIISYISSKYVISFDWNLI